jgi:CDP-diacylglycerol--glycerol-3-phosphate 3-phosphatidyltransferase
MGLELADGPAIKADDAASAAAGTSQAAAATVTVTAGALQAGHAGVGAQWRLRTAANGVTVARIVATPVLVLVVLHAAPSWWALALWAVLAFSDMADGWLARRHGASASGAFLDPLADKFVVLGALAALAALGRFTWAPVALLAGRELFITAYRAAVARHGVSVPARRTAKAKTLVEFVTVGLVLLPAHWSLLLTVAHASLWVSVGLAWASAAQYLLDSRAAGRRAAITGN